MYFKSGSMTFRHSYVYLFVNNEVNITVVVKYLGHTKIKETLNTYKHLFNSALNEIIDLIDKLENKGYVSFLANFILQLFLLHSLILRIIHHLIQL